MLVEKETMKVLEPTSGFLNELYIPLTKEINFLLIDHPALL